MKQLSINTLLIILFLTLNAFAQSPIRVGGSFNVIFPSGDYTQLAKSGIGGTFESDYTFTPEFSIIFSSSYSDLTSKIPQIGIDGKAVDFSIQTFDALLGGRYNINYSLFALAKTGVSYLKLHANIYDAPSSSTDNVSSDYEPYFTIGFGGGYRYNLAKEKSDFELSAIYNYVSGDIINFNTFLLKASLMVYL